MDTIRRHASDDETSVKQATCGSLLYCPLEDIEGVPSIAIMNIDQSSAASTVIGEGEQVAANKLTSKLTDRFSAILSDVTF